MKIPREIDKAIFIACCNKRWEKCMFGYVVHEKEVTIRVYVKKKKEKRK